METTNSYRGWNVIRQEDEPWNQKSKVELANGTVRERGPSGRKVWVMGNGMGGGGETNWV